MDRLVIESILADVDEIHLSNDNQNPELNPSIVLSFKAQHTDQVIHAFTALKKVVHNSGVSLVICKTMTSGIYDLEIKTDALDEPVRILNKVISHELLLQLEEEFHKGKKIALTTNVSEEENWISLSNAEIKECAI